MLIFQLGINKFQVKSVNIFLTNASISKTNAYMPINQVDFHFDPGKVSHWYFNENRNDVHCL